jgi:hypothetical protein
VSGNCVHLIHTERRVITPRPQGSLRGSTFRARDGTPPSRSWPATRAGKETTAKPRALEAFRVTAQRSTAGTIRHNPSPGARHLSALCHRRSLRALTHFEMEA